MKVDEIRGLSADELTEKLASLKEELFGLRFQHATGQLDNPMHIIPTSSSFPPSLREQPPQSTALRSANW